MTPHTSRGRLAMSCSEWHALGAQRVDVLGLLGQGRGAYQVKRLGTKTGLTPMNIKLTDLRKRVSPHRNNERLGGVKAGRATPRVRYNFEEIALTSGPWF